MSLFEKLYERIEALPVVDTHEHMDAREPDSWGDTDAITGLLVKGYAHTTLLTSGMKCDVQPAQRTLTERWREIDPYWQDCRFTGYMRAPALAVKDLLGIEKINGSTIEEINERFLASLKPGVYEDILQTRSRIATALVDTDFHCDKRYFRSVFRIDRYVTPSFEDDVSVIERDTGVKIRTLDNWIEAFEAELKIRLDQGVVALKCALAYKRTLRFDRASYQDARRAFDEMYSLRYRPGHMTFNRCGGQAFQDYVMHEICRIAERYGVTMQVHTGLLEGNSNCLHHANPELLSNLFVEYPDLRFDLFHISYPYQNIAGALAKMFPNVYLDMCWAHIISPEASIATLEEWLDLLPICKISAFGGDYFGTVPHLIYGHCKLAKINLCKTFVRKIEKGCMDEDEALVIARKLLFDNPVELFGMHNDPAILGAKRKEPSLWDM